MPSGQPLANVPLSQAAQIAAAMAGMPGLMPGMMPGMPGSQPTPLAIPGLPTPMIGQGGVSQAGPGVENQPAPEQDLMPFDPQLANSGPTADSDKDVQKQPEPTFIEKPWFAKLPPELRNAIRSNAQRRPPRGYEEWLKRYFESVDEAE